MSRQWTIVIDCLGRPLLNNQVHGMHHQEAGRARREWRDVAATLCRAQRIPPLDAIRITTWAEYPSRRSLPDCDATAPALKGALDGLVVAQVIPDDRPPHVAGITYLPPVVRTQTVPALVLEITEVES